MNEITTMLKFGQLCLAGQLTSALPLENTQVKAKITGLACQVTVTQNFSNPLHNPAELEYLFPLPHSAALLDFELRIGARIVKASLQESGQALETYEQAASSGQHASLLEQRRSNLFALKLANVMPGEKVSVTILYQERLTLQKDLVEFVFPMGLTPRYTSPTQPGEGADVNPPLAMPGEPVGPVEIQLAVDLGVETSQPTSPSHSIRVENTSPHQWQVNTAAACLPDHDFVVRFPLVGAGLELGAWSSLEKNGESLLVSWLPPAGQLTESAVQPREFIFILDRSGSMSGEPIQQARNALRACLRILEPQDSFRILLFDDRLEWYRSDPSNVTQSEIDRADRYLNQVDGRGGTEIIPAIEAALSLPADPGRTRYLVFLTDGAVSAEDRALAAIRKQLKQARIFTFGIGPSVNRALLSGLARMGRGAADFLQLDEDIEGAILRFQDKVAFPLLTDLRLEWTGCQAWDIYPEILPDLYEGDALEFVAHLQRNNAQEPVQLTLSGMRGGQIVRMALILPPALEYDAVVSRSWAQARLSALLEQQQNGSGAASHQVRQEIIHLSLAHHLITPFTSFVAVDSLVSNASGSMQPIAIAQPLPKGLDWSGFISTNTAAGLPPQAPMMAAFSMPAPSPMAQPGFTRARRSSLPSSGKGGGDRKIADQTSSDYQPPEELFKSEPHEENRPAYDSADALRWLARHQRINGSWEDDGELTAAALLAFIRHGQTGQAGHYRKQVQRACQWLEKTKTKGPAAFISAAALHEFANMDGGSIVLQTANTLLAGLPKPQNSLEQAALVAAGLDTRPSSITNLSITPENLPLLALLKQPVPKLTELLRQEPSLRTYIWAVVLG